MRHRGRGNRWNQKKEVGNPTSFCFTALRPGLLSENFAERASAAADAVIHYQSNVAFSNASLTDRTIGDEREAVGELEAALSDDVPLEIQEYPSLRGHRRCSARMPVCCRRQHQRWSSVQTEPDRRLLRRSS